MDLEFEWDEEKDLINRKKHGISFQTASLVFNDKNYIEMYDFEHGGREDRTSQSSKLEGCCSLFSQNGVRESG